MSNPRVAILGATGLVGREFLNILEQRDFPMESLRLLASERSAGRRIPFKGSEIEVEQATHQSFQNVDLALFSAGGSRSLEFAPVAAKAGAVVVDNSSAWRMEPGIPLVVPEVNPEDIAKHEGIIANPNCSTIQMVVALNPLHKANPIKRIIVDTYQAVAGTGKAAIDELTTQSKRVLESQEVVPHVYPHQIAFNLLPQIDVFMDNGYTKEEWKMVQETRKIMHADYIAISATCVRVPVWVGHSEAVHVEFTYPMSPEEAKDILSKAPGIKVVDDPSVNLYPLPKDAVGLDDTFVGRIRSDASHPNGLALWVVSDNLRKGAALNAVQIAEVLVERGWLLGGQKS
ncbi:MAG: aspartate-semialdehyde dehydrogenase [Chloroflexota bacterium]|nr:aspartate-semialdehyde dehydrogenase [Chloroflexota bacterium]